MPAETVDVENYKTEITDLNKISTVDELNKKLNSPSVSNCSSTTQLSVSPSHDSSITYQTRVACTANSNDDMCLKEPEKISKSVCFDSVVFNGKYVKKTLRELESYSLNDLRILVSDLSKAVEEISNQLVQLLLENDALQQESDARNVAIEQLLKITVKVTENELKPVQMSVILSSEQCEDV